MEACGIIAEYNPLHQGHIYHLRTARKQTGLPIIVALSGSFVQRGEPALLNKFSRAAHAVKNGADLVLELPTAFTLRSAQYFATGGVELLKATGLVTALSCGTEHPDFPYQEAAEYINSPQFQNKLHTLISEGASYAAASSQLLADLKPQYQFKEPNDILALEYTKALTTSRITPFYLQRRDLGYNSLNLDYNRYASASAIRHSLTTQNSREELLQAVSQLQAWVPSEVYLDLQKLLAFNLSDAFLNPFTTASTLWLFLKYQLMLNSPEQIKHFTLVSEGLENLLHKATGAATYAEAVSLCTGKRYPSSRVRRLFCQLLLQLPKEHYEQQAPAYLRVLAFNDIGRQLLKAMKTTAALPVLTKLGRNPFEAQSDSFRQQLELDCRATDCWSLLHPGHLPLQSDFLQSPLYFQNK